MHAKTNIFIFIFMDILCVVGGSYKNFYINVLKNYPNIDLIIFQSGIIYDFVYYDEIFGLSNVSKELATLSKNFSCDILACAKTDLFGDIHKSLIYFSKGNICDIKNESEILDFSCENIQISASLKYESFLENDNFKILLIEDKFDIEKYAYDNVIKNGIICDKISANFIKNGEVNRKFQKYCDFILN